MGKSTASFYCASIVTGLLALVSTTAAVTVHRWTDEHGVVHFGDHPPEGVVTESAVIEFDDPPEVSIDEDAYSVVRQWERVRAERDQADALALERERIRAVRINHIIRWNSIQEVECDCRVVTITRSSRTNNLSLW